MGKMFFNNSSYDFFKRDEPIGYMEARPKPKKVKVKTTKTPPPMAKAKERVVKNKDGTITLHKIDKGGFTQTINIYTGRQQPSALKAKGQRSVRKDKTTLFTPNGRPDFKKCELYQSAFYNQLINDRLRKLKDKEDGKLEAPENVQAIVDKASDNIRRDLEKLEDRQTRSLDEIHRQQARDQSLHLEWTQDLLRKGKRRGGHYTRSDTETSASEHIPVHFYSQREKDRMRKEAEAQEAKIVEIEEEEPIAEEEATRLSQRGVEAILRRITEGKIKRGHIKGLQKRVGEELSEEQFSKIEDAFEAYLGALQSQVEDRWQELQRGEVVTDDLKSTTEESEQEYLREGARLLGRERKKFLRSQRIPKEKYYSENWGEQTLYETQPTPDWFSYFGEPDTHTDLEVTAVKLGVNPLGDDGTPKGIKKLGQEMVDAGTARQVERWEQKMDSDSDRDRAIRSSRQARPQGIPATQRELAKVGGDVALHRTKEGVVTAVKDYRRQIGGQWRTVESDIKAERQKLTNKNQVIDKYFLGDQQNLIGEKGKETLKRLLGEGKITPKAYRETEKLRKALRGTEKERRREAKAKEEPAYEKARTKAEELDSGGEQEGAGTLLEEVLSPRVQPEPQAEAPSPLRQAVKKLEKQTGALEQELEQAVSPRPRTEPKAIPEVIRAQDIIEGLPRRTTPPFHQEALGGGGALFEAEDRPKDPYAEEEV